jgi:hypothetical protein
LARWRWFFAILALCLAVSGCRDLPKPKKPDPTKAAVTGLVLCSDTGKPARFATVTLSVLPGKDDKPDNDEALPATERAVTGLDGRFRFEAVEPGRYFAFATLEGYLDPKMSVDLTRLGEKATGQERILDAIDQWKDHLVEVTVNAHLTSDISLQVERGAEIEGTVTYDDGTPAIGIWPEVYRKTSTKGWTPVGPRGSAFSPVVDAHGRFSLTNLSAGEYIVCTVLPAESDDLAPRICLGNVFRTKNAKSIKVHAGEIVDGADITIPLSGLHTVAGHVTVFVDGHVPDHATIRLLYADDREQARVIYSLDDGGFSFPFIPEGKYILQVAGANDAEQQITKTNPDGSSQTITEPNSARHYADKEVPVTVEDDMNDIQITLSLVQPAQPVPPAMP